MRQGGEDKWKEIQRAYFNYLNHLQFKNYISIIVDCSLKLVTRKLTLFLLPSSSKEKKKQTGTKEDKDYIKTACPSILPLGTQETTAQGRAINTMVSENIHGNCVLWTTKHEFQVVLHKIHLFLKPGMNEHFLLMNFFFILDIKNTYRTIKGMGRNANILWNIYS